MSDKLVKVMVRAKEIIRSPHYWTKDAEARDSYNTPTLQDSYYACKWCMSAAIDKAYKDVTGDVIPIDYLISITDNKYIYHQIVAFNDDPTTTHPKVMEAMDEYIQLAKDAATGGHWNKIW